MQRNWRVMGMWLNGTQFLLTLGVSRAACEKRMNLALEDYTIEDLENFDSVWLERWDEGTEFRSPGWEPVDFLSLRSFKLRKLRRAAAQFSKQRKPAVTPTTPLVRSLLAPAAAVASVAAQ